MSSTAIVAPGFSAARTRLSSGDDLLGGEVVDDVEQQRAVVGAAELGLEHVAVAMDDAVAHPRGGDDLPSDPRASRAGRRTVAFRSRVAAAQRRGEPAVSAGHVEQRGRVAAAA